MLNDVLGLDVTGASYDFPVEKFQMYFFTMENEKKEVKLDNSSQKCIVRTDTNDVLGTCSDRYKIITHNVVMEYLGKLMHEMGFDGAKTNIYLWKKGAFLYAFSELNNKTYDINGKKIIPNIVAINSYNGLAKAAIKVRFVDDDGVVYGEGMTLTGTKSIESSAVAMHKGPNDINSDFTKLIRWVPMIITNMIDSWTKWQLEKISGNRVRILSQLISPMYGRYVEKLGYLSNGCSRYEFYAAICAAYINVKSFDTYGKSGTFALNKFKKIICDDYYYDPETDDNELENNLKKQFVFNWETIDEDVKRKQRTQLERVSSKKIVARTVSAPSVQEVKNTVVVDEPEDIEEEVKEEVIEEVKKEEVIDSNDFFDDEEDLNTKEEEDDVKKMIEEDTKVSEDNTDDLGIGW